MGLRKRCMTGFIAWTLAQVGTAFAQEAPSEPPAVPAPATKDVDALPELPQRFLGNAVSVLGAPASWDSKDWGHFALAVGVVVGTAVALDRPVQDAFQRNRTEGRDKVARKLENFGSSYAIATAGGFYLAGLVGGDSEARATGVDAISASLITGAIIVPALKHAIGRARPEEQQGPNFFKPSIHGDASFPSGHTTEAFTVASVIAAHYENIWVQGTAYGLASLAGLARLEQNGHYASDVVAGALIGITVGRAVTRLNQRQRAIQHSKFQAFFVPDIRPGGYRGLQAGVVF